VLADQDVFERGHRREQADVLERPRHAPCEDAVGSRVCDVLAFEEDPARRRPVQAGEHVEEGRLAGAVRTDDRDDRFLGDVEADVVDCRQAAERLRDRERLEQGALVQSAGLLLGLGDLCLVAHARTS
jgi:hypothetical protein